MKITAALLRELNTPFEVVELDLEEPREGEVLVRMVAAGVCHSDLSRTTGVVPNGGMPIVLGHEGAGIVEQVGSGVTDLKPGDHVVMNWRPACGKCRYCLRGRPALCPNIVVYRGRMTDGSFRMHYKGTPVYYFTSLSTFCTHVTVGQESCVKIDDDIPFTIAALVGCGVTTGTGAVLKTAHVPPDSSVAVWGAGGVGLNVIQGAVLAKANPIIAVDVRPQKLQMAKDFGATHLINAAEENPVEAIKKITGGGADYTFEAIGRASTCEQAFAALGPGGTCCVVGIAPPSETMPVTLANLPLGEHAIIGSFFGSANPPQDIVHLLDLYRHRQLKLDELVTRTYTLDQINDAMKVMETGDIARGVILFE